MKNNTVSTICKGVGVASLLFFGIISLAVDLLKDNAAAVNGAFNIQTQFEIPGNAVEDTVYYKSAFKNVKEVIANGKKVIQASIEEGSVLLKNDNNALPIKLNNGKANVSVFSVGSTQLIMCGAGSGAQSSDQNKTYSRDLKNSFERVGLMVNPDLWNWYNSNTKNTAKTFGPVSTGSGAGDRFYTVGEASWNEIGTAAKTSADYGDAAIFVLARNGAENQDLSRNYDRTDHRNECQEFTNGNYLALTADEVDVLKNLTAEKKKGTFKSVIVLINSAYPFQVDFLDNQDIDVDSILWCGSLGTNGIDGVSNLLVGNVNPSGRLSDTWFTHYLYNPANWNFGDYTYLGGSSSADMGQSKYVVYQEGVYVGYKYSETRYEDLVMKNPYVGDYDYAKQIAYPFGYGLSYTNFEYTNFKTTYDKGTDEFTFSVDVKNVGQVAGKEAVQFYIQKPYTFYDIDYGVEKPAVELVEFGKTKKLAPGASETVTVKVARRELASYDSNGAHTYIVDAGDYYATVAKDAHNAINNILKLKETRNVAIDTTKMVGEGDKTLATVIETVEKFDDVTYSTAAATGNKITNQFNNADPRMYHEHVSNPESNEADPYGERDLANANNLTYLSRKDWEWTFPTDYVKMYRTAKMNLDDDVARGKHIQKDDGEYPTYGKNSGDTAKLIKLVEMKGLDYDDPKWEDFLDQLTFDETEKLLLDGLRLTGGLDRLGKPKTVDHNGSNGVTQAFNVGPLGFATKLNDPDKSQKPVIYCCTGIVASTFNKELINMFGRQWGEDCLWAGYSGIYGPSINIHRSAYNGRNFEYWSEDPVLSGLAVAELSKGLMTRGVYVYLKHCALNDQETNRHGLNVWANEQSVREIYFKPFQIAIEQGDAAGVMTGFHCVGAKWTSAQGFCKTVLRDEFGMKGIAVTDFYKDTYPYMKLVPGVLNGNDLPDGTESNKLFTPYKTGYSKIGWAMRESAKHIMYTVANSNAMNLKSKGTQLITIEPAWLKTADAVKVGGSALLYISIAALVGVLVLDVLKRLKKFE